jgi:hypothetical protein
MQERLRNNMQSRALKLKALYKKILFLAGGLHW